MTDLILELFNEAGERSLMNISKAVCVDPGEPDLHGNESIILIYNKEDSIQAYGISYDQLKELIAPPFDAELRNHSQNVKQESE